MRGRRTRTAERKQTTPWRWSTRSNPWGRGSGSRPHGGDETPGPGPWRTCQPQPPPLPWGWSSRSKPLRIWEPPLQPDLLERMISSDEVRGCEGRKGRGEGGSAGGEVGGRSEGDAAARIWRHRWWRQGRSAVLGLARERGGLAAVGGVRAREKGWVGFAREGGFAAVGWDGSMYGWMDGLMFARSSVQATSDSTNQN